MKKYNQNLRITADGYVQSYEIKVAKINHVDGTLTVLGYWSMTTTKHINYVAEQMNLKIIKAETK